MSDTTTSESTEAHDEITVIPVTDFRNANGEFEHRLPPPSALKNPAEILDDHPDVHLPSGAIRLVMESAVEPHLVDNRMRFERHRVETGWLIVMTYRAYSPLISPAIENDRLLADVRYSADPRGGTGHMALAMPQPHSEHTLLVHDDDHSDVLESLDRSASSVMTINAQEVGRRLVERPLMLVPATFRSEAGQPCFALTAVDGNCRLCSCYCCIPIRKGWLDDALIGEEKNRFVGLKPSHLMRMPPHQRRELTRKVIKESYTQLRKKRTGTAANIKARNEAAAALNALTVPAQVIVGYWDDDPRQGTQRFPAAVRALLMRMNVGVKPFDSGAQNAVTAEEIVTGLYDAHLLGDEPIGTALRDALIGRGDVASAMKELGLDPRLPDLRFALIMQQLSRTEPRFKVVVRSKLPHRDLTRSNLVLSRRSGAVVELGLRSYSGSMDITVPRKSLDTVCLWHDLIASDWTVENVNTDEKVEDLLRRANEESGQGPAGQLLGALGMIALVMSRHLLAAAGSAEVIAGRSIARSSVGQIIKGLLESSEGRQLLADAVKRVRAGEKPRWWDHKEEDLVDQPEGWRGSTFNAQLRAAVRHGFGAKSRGKTAAEQEADTLTAFQETLRQSDDRLRDLRELRERNGTTDRLPWPEVESSFKRIEVLEKGLRRISEDEPE